MGAERFNDQIEAAVARSVRTGQTGCGNDRAAGGLGSEQGSLRFEENAK